MKMATKSMRWVLLQAHHRWTFRLSFDRHFNFVHHFNFLGYILCSSITSSIIALNSSMHQRVHLENQNQAWTLKEPTESWSSVFLSLYPFMSQIICCNCIKSETLLLNLWVLCLCSSLLHRYCPKNSDSAESWLVFNSDRRYHSLIRLFAAVAFWCRTEWWLWFEPKIYLLL